MEENKNQNNNIENPIYIIGTDASGPEKLPYFLQERILSAKKIAAPLIAEIEG